MKILLADDGQSLRSVVGSVLEPALKQDGHELLLVSQGDATRQFFLKSDAPHVVILDKSLPGLDGIQFCQQIREKETAIRPHVILTYDGSNPEEALQGLDAGADDCLTAPIKPAELLARIRAAVRIIKHELRLCQEIIRRDSIIKQNNLSLSSAQAAGAVPPESAAARPVGAGEVPVAPTPAAAAPTLQQIVAALFPIAELEQLVGQTLSSMGIGDPTPVHDAATSEAFSPSIGIVHFIILPQKNAWLDLLLETDQASAVALYQTFTGATDTPPASDLVDVVGETLNMVQGTLKATFKSKGMEVLIPLVPQSISPQKVALSNVNSAISSRHLYQLPGIQLRFTLFAYFSPPTMKALKEIKIANVLAEPLRPGGNSDLVLINKGTMLNARALKKVTDLAEFSSRTLTHPVYNPSPLTAFLTT